jgi:DNA modification methylase
MTIHHGDCVEVMVAMPPDSIDAIVCDPPYGLEFMGKEWDRLWGKPEQQAEPFTGSDGVTRTKTSAFSAHHPRPTYIAGAQAQAFHADWATAALRVAKPGAYLLAFGGTRTVHRMTVALEDAGWIIRDMLVWAYASGFPKSKALLKPAWEPIVMARKPGPLRDLDIDGCRIGTPPAERGGTRERVRGYVGIKSADVVPANPPNDAGRWPANVVLTDPVFDGGWDGVVGGGETGPGGSVGGNGLGSHFGNATDQGKTHRQGNAPLGDTGTYSRFFQLNGGSGCYLCGHAKPAEPSSSPSRPSDASAPGHAPTEASPGSDTTTDSPATSATEMPFWPDDDGSTPSIPRSKRRGTSPASTRPSSSARSLDATSPGTGTTTTMADRWTCDTCADLITSHGTSDEHESLPEREYPRFLIFPKASRSDREPVMPGMLEERADVAGAPERSIKRCANCGSARLGEAGVHICRPGCPEKRLIAELADRRTRANVHPTVKPIELMRHLVRLVTPAGGTVLDPFLGSGTTALAAEQEGRQWVGIEREAEYVRIAEARLSGWQRGLGLDI